MKYVLAILLLIACASPAFAETGLKGDAPIAIDADNLEVIQSDSKAIFSGNVVAKQDKMTLKSASMTVFYGAKPAGSTAAFGSLSKIEVVGNVSLVTPTESATANRGLYDATTNKVFLTGNVVLKRGGNVLNGSKLEYNLTSGSSLLSGGVSGIGVPNTDGNSTGRVRGLFIPEQKKE
jgi:lipopolysaccharide export system protein LptA